MIDLLKNWLSLVYLTRLETKKLEGTHRAKTLVVIAVVTQMCINIGAIVISVKMHLLAFELSIPSHIFSRIFQDHYLYQVWTLWDHSFLSYAADKQTDKQTDK